jgi:hypothetical protein
VSSNTFGESEQRIGEGTRVVGLAADRHRGARQRLGLREVASTREQLGPHRPPLDL